MRWPTPSRSRSRPGRARHRPRGGQRRHGLRRHRRRRGRIPRGDRRRIEHRLLFVHRPGRNVDQLPAHVGPPHPVRGGSRHRSERLQPGAFRHLPGHLQLQRPGDRLQRRLVPGFRFLDHRPDPSVYGYLLRDGDFFPQFGIAGRAFDGGLRAVHVYLRHGRGPARRRHDVRRLGRRHDHRRLGRRHHRGPAPGYDRLRVGHRNHSRGFPLLERLGRPESDGQRGDRRHADGLSLRRLRRFQ